MAFDDNDNVFNADFEKGPLSRPGPIASSSTVDNPERIVCELCETSFSSKGNLSRHMIKLHPTVEMNVSMVVSSVADNPERTTCEPDPIASSSIADNPERTTCELDPIASSSIADNPERIICELCKISFSSKGNLSRHMKKLHPTEMSPITSASSIADNPARTSCEPDPIASSSIADNPERIICELCKISFSSKGNLSRHMKKLHPTEMSLSTSASSIADNPERIICELDQIASSSIADNPKRIICELCEISFSLKGGLLKHMRKFHPTVEFNMHKTRKDSVSNISCECCGVPFSRKQNLRRHMKKHHPTVKMSLSCKNLICVICEDAFMSMAELHDHFEIRHTEISLSFEKKTFTALEEFEMWKKNIELDTQSSFIRRNSNVQLADGKVATYFQCHRSGNYHLKELRVRRVKNQGSIKIGKTCPANIKMYDKEVDGVHHFKVEYQSVHVGHKLQVRRFPLIKEDMDLDDQDEVCTDLDDHDEVCTALTALTKELKKSVFSQDIEREKKSLISKWKDLVTKSETSEQLNVLRNTLNMGEVKWGLVPQTIPDLQSSN